MSRDIGVMTFVIATNVMTRVIVIHIIMTYFIMSRIIIHASS